MYGGSVREDGGSITPSPEEPIMNQLESVPTTWDDVRDVQFFRIVCHVLEPHVLEAASCLLGANDADLAPSA
jgi:hypothetical protein